MKVIGNGLVLFVLALLLVSCSSGTGAPDEETKAIPDKPAATEASVEVSSAGVSAAKVVASSVGSDDSRLRVKLGGLDSNSIPIRNGGLIDFGDGLKAELFVDPYPTDTLTSWVDVYLTNGPLDEPVDNAEVQMEYDMWSMAHGPYIGAADSSINGHYVFRLDYIMFGAWEQVLEVRKPGSDDVHRLTLMIVAFP